MTTRRRQVDKRLFDAVMLVLAGSGCYTSAPPAKHDTQTGSQHNQTADGQVDPWAAAPAKHSPPQHTPVHTPQYTPPVSPALAQAQQVCATYKRTKLDPKQIPPLPRNVAGQSPIGETSNWDAGLNAARCVIVRDHRTGDVSVTYEPRCCPTPGPAPQNCPGPQTYTVKAPLLLVERANVAQDGTVLASDVRWTGIEPHREPEPYCGRLPEGAVALGQRATGQRTMAHHLAAMAELEAASVSAFERLAVELAAHGAPAALVRRAYTAMRDEIRHERVMRAFAMQHGAQPRPIAVVELPCRSLAAIGRENAVEGCVREAYGALVATYQGERAPLALRKAFRSISRDERRHAELAEDVHAWIMRRLDEDAAREIEAARDTAVAELRASLPEMPACEELGMPSRVDAVALFDAYFGADTVVRSPRQRASG